MIDSSRTLDQGTVVSIVVIGGGFTGLAFVIHAIRARPAGVNLDFTIVEPSAELGRGIAYGTTEPLHRINVPSDRMSLFANDSTHATRWLREHEALDAGSVDEQGHYYVSRQRYGEYVDATLKQVVAEAAPNVRVSHRRASATRLSTSNAGYIVKLDDGSQLETQRVALCFGHTPSKPPGRIDEDALRDPRLIAHPWSHDALHAIPRDASVLLVGTGLTMADVAVTLIGREHRGRITAISRRGLRAQPHGIFADAADFRATRRRPPPRANWCKGCVSESRATSKRTSAGSLPPTHFASSFRASGTRCPRTNNAALSGGCCRSGTCTGFVLRRRFTQPSNGRLEQGR
jgi:uncharacterized NAD(P)/FAD-binding protein YdhS